MVLVSDFDIRASDFLSLDEFDLVAFLQRHDRFLPMRGSAVIGRPLTFLFAPVVRGVDGDHFLLKKLFHRSFDLNFVGPPAHAKNVFVLFIA